MFLFAYRISKNPCNCPIRTGLDWTEVLSCEVKEILFASTPRQFLTFIRMDRFCRALIAVPSTLAWFAGLLPTARPFFTWRAANAGFVGDIAHNTGGHYRDKGVVVT